MRVLSEAGIYHPDLNLNNCIVREEDGTIEVFVIDFDRARVRETSLRGRLRRRMLRRLERSARRLEPERQVIGTDELNAFRDACWNP